MNYLQFRRQFYDFGCFNVHQVYAWQADFDKNNLSRWVKKNLLVKLRNGYYSFPEYIHFPSFMYFVSNQIYSPSYISLHSALSFYDMIPEAIIRITAVSSLKRATFENRFGTFIYQQIAADLLFGYDMKPFPNNRTLLFAQPEKALLDLLYLYPFYNTEQEMIELRIDEDFLEHDFDVQRFIEYAGKFNSKALSKRADLFLKTYNLL